MPQSARETHEYGHITSRPTTAKHFSASVAVARVEIILNCNYIEQQLSTASIIRA